MRLTRRLVAGIDPGASTGLVLAEYAGTRLLACTGWTIRRPRTSRTRTAVDAECAHVRALRDALRTLPPACEAIAIECPADISDGWQGAGLRRRGYRTARGTGFRLGAAYGCAVAAAVDLGIPLAAYGVRGDRQTPGWMTGLGGGRARREPVYQQLTLLARSVGASLSDDQLAALGVATYHVISTTRTP